MERRYTRLKLKLLLIALLSAGAAAVLGWLAMELLGGGASPMAGLFVWVMESLFGRDKDAALALYERCKAPCAALAAAVVMLAVFWLVMGLFTRRLNQIGAALRQVSQETGAPVELPAELAPIQAELSALQATLAARQAQARAEEARKNDLLVFLAHDLKTPLTSVIGYLNLLRDGPHLTPQQRAKYTGIALDKALRLEELIGEFFHITREGLHQSASAWEEVHLDVLLEQLADEFLPQFQDKGLTCRTDIAPRLTVMGAGDKLARVFDNVLRNAVSYSVEGGTVAIEAVGREGQAVITIRNQGLEIPEGELARIFEKFYRLDSARSTRTGGAGLGLAIAREIVEAHAGSIHAESNGRTTAFTIRLPIASQRCRARALVHAAEASALTGERP